MVVIGSATAVTLVRSRKPRPVTCAALAHLHGVRPATDVIEWLGRLSREARYRSRTLENV